VHQRSPTLSRICRGEETVEGEQAMVEPVEGEEEILPPVEPEELQADSKELRSPNSRNNSRIHHKHLSKSSYH